MYSVPNSGCSNTRSFILQTEYSTLYLYFLAGLKQANIRHKGHSDDGNRTDGTEDPTHVECSYITAIPFEKSKDDTRGGIKEQDNKLGLT